MSFPITLDGKVFSLSDFQTNAYVDNLPKLINSIQADKYSGLVRTGTNSGVLAVAGTYVFTDSLQDPVIHKVNQFVLVIPNAAVLGSEVYPAFGIVTAATTTTITVKILAKSEFSAVLRSTDNKWLIVTSTVAAKGSELSAEPENHSGNFLVNKYRLSIGEDHRYYRNIVDFNQNIVNQIDQYNIVTSNQYFDTVYQDANLYPSPANHPGVVQATVLFAGDVVGMTLGYNPYIGIRGINQTKICFMLGKGAGRKGKTGLTDSDKYVFSFGLLGSDFIGASTVEQVLAMTASNSGDTYTSGTGIIASYPDSIFNSGTSAYQSPSLDSVYDSRDSTNSAVVLEEQVWYSFAILLESDVLAKLVITNEATGVISTSSVSIDTGYTAGNITLIPFFRLHKLSGNKRVDIFIDYISTEADLKSRPPG